MDERRAKPRRPRPAGDQFAGQMRKRSSGQAAAKARRTRLAVFDTGGIVLAKIQGLRGMSTTPIDLKKVMMKQLTDFYRRAIILVCSLLASIYSMNTVTMADSGAYRLRAGDTVGISVAGVPEMRQTLALDLDGQISVPLVGVLKAEGSTIGELRDKLQHMLSEKVLRQTGTNGQDVERIIQAQDISVNIVDYSPVYVNGDVVKPGEQRFRPNMIVRQAVALAGGYEVMREHLVDPVIQSADLGADYETLWTEQAREQARLARLKAQLNNEAQLGAGAAERTPVSNQLQRDIVSNESQQLALWHTGIDKEMAFLTRAIQSATDQLAELVEQRDKEKEGAAADSAELQRLSTFNEQGHVTSNRVVDARRALLLSSTRVLQTEGQIGQVTREKEEYISRIEKLKDSDKSTTLKEIEECQLKLAAINAHIAAIADKMDYMSTMRSQLRISKLGGPSVIIIRGDRENRSELKASEDTILEPGDVIEISVIPKTKLTDAVGSVVGDERMPVWSGSVGINMEGAEYSWVGYPTLADLQNVKSEGVNLVRLPIAWEMMQPTLNGPLSASYLDGLKTFLNNAASLGIGVVVDLHDSGRYDLNWAADAAANHGIEAPNGSDASVLGSAAVPISAFANFWQQLATALKGNPGVAGYDIMNEPNNMPTPQTWPTAAQAAVNAIRTVDMNTPIVVEGDGWAAAQFWQTNNANLKITDPANNIIYSAHSYFDNSSGTYSKTYAQYGNTPQTGVQDVAPFLQWLKTNGYRGFVGEFGVPSNDPQWIPLLSNVLSDLQANGVSATVWNYEMPDSSPAWWVSQIESTSPGNLNIAPVKGAVTPQMALIFKHSRPVIESDTAGATTGSLSLNGSAAGGSVVSVFEQGVLLGTTKATVDGSWNFTTAALSAGTHIFTASSTDSSGNVSKTSAAYSSAISSAAATPVVTRW